MPTDKSATILEAQWMEKEIPRIEEELAKLRKTEQELLTSPLQTVSRAYTTTYRAERQLAHRFYRRRRSVTPTRYGYRTRMLDVGWFTILARVLIVALVALAVYITYRGYRAGRTESGVTWGSVVLFVAIGLSVAPALGDHLWERRARKKAEIAAQEARQSDAFLQERQERQQKLSRVRARAADSKDRLRFAHLRLEELRRELTSTDHGGSPGE